MTNRDNDTVREAEIAYWSALYDLMSPIDAVVAIEKELDRYRTQKARVLTDLAQRLPHLPAADLQEIQRLVGEPMDETIARLEQLRAKYRALLPGPATDR